jgi:hypothetical protein
VAILEAQIRDDVNRFAAGMRKEILGERGSWCHEAPRGPKSPVSYVLL